ncbi:uncharacterized protein LOC131625196 [Vicia villosa]|uniref:uncharacterized protein LOC131625196 n=1 Tax=Vicia villosa TaxID=3911 RepID=UPI00273C40D5|nr:uncharacterized protein LOC131625196 [Vicia villosa]XP_058752072.1 uncharacterized protein LOC131625196 [Vicia villosa]
MHRVLLPMAESSVERGRRLKRKRKRKHVVETVTRLLQSELKDLLMVRVLLPESSLERGKMLKRVRKHAVEHVVERVIRLLISELKNVDDLVGNFERRLKSEWKHVEDDLVERGTPPKSDSTYNKQNRNSRKKQFVADRKKQFRANMAARRKHRKSRNLSEYDAVYPPLILPPLLRPIGGIGPYSIDGVNSGRIAGYCKTALKEFNECNHQDPKFDFDGLVKATHRLPTTYFITFKAKKQDDASPTIFQTNIKGKFDRSFEVISCAIKKD